MRRYKCKLTDLAKACCCFLTYSSSKRVPLNAGELGNRSAAATSFNETSGLPGHKLGLAVVIK